MTAKSVLLRPQGLRPFATPLREVNFSQNLFLQQLFCRLSELVAVLVTLKPDSTLNVKI